MTSGDVATNPASGATPPEGKPAIPAGAKREVGVVRWFNARKCFGFLSTAEGAGAGSGVAEENDGAAGHPPDIFVHQSQLHMPPESFRTLIPGMKVEFTRATQEAKQGDGAAMIAQDPSAVGDGSSAAPGERLLAMDVTAIGGGWIVLPPWQGKRTRTRQVRGDRGRGNKGGGVDGHDVSADEHNAVITDGEDNGEVVGGKDSSAAPKEGGGNEKKKTNSRQRRRNRRRKENEATGDEGHEGDIERADKGDSEAKHESHDNTNIADVAAAENGEPRVKKPHWHEQWNEEVRNYLMSKGINLRGSAVDIVVDGQARVKMGSEGYATYVSAKGVVAEGSYTFTPSGVVTLDLKKAIEYDKASKEWKVVADISGRKDIMQTLYVGLPVASGSDTPDSTKGHVEPMKWNDPVAAAYAQKVRQAQLAKDGDGGEDEDHEPEDEERHDDEAKGQATEEQPQDPNLIPQPSPELLQAQGFQMRSAVHHKSRRYRGRGGAPQNNNQGDGGGGRGGGARRGPRNRRARGGGRGRGGGGGKKPNQGESDIQAEGVAVETE